MTASGEAGIISGQLRKIGRPGPPRLHSRRSPVRPAETGGDAVRYLRAGFHPEWDRDPYRVFAYTTVQERATQHSHSETGEDRGGVRARLASVLSQVAKEEARHYTFYRTVFQEILEARPRSGPALRLVYPACHRHAGGESCRASRTWPTSSGEPASPDRCLPGIVPEQIRYWKIGSIGGAQRVRAKAQEKIMGIPAASNASRNTSKPGARPRPLASRWCLTASSRWNDAGVRPGVLATVIVTLAGCQSSGSASRRGPDASELPLPSAMPRFSAERSSSWSTGQSITADLTWVAPQPISSRWV